MVRLHQDFVYGAVLRVVRNPILAEDVTQETFIRAYRGLDEFRGEAQLRTWLYRIATNRAINAITRGRETPMEGELLGSALSPSPETEVEMAHLRDHLVAAIGELPEVLRIPLTMREFDGSSYQEIADQLNVPLNTVRTRILRARRALQHRMESWQ